MRQLVIITSESTVGVTLHDQGVWPALEVDRLLRCGGARTLAQVHALARSLDPRHVIVEVVHRPARSSAYGGRTYPETTFCRVIDMSPSNPTTESP